jgi:hypothetical protein
MGSAAAVAADRNRPIAAVSDGKKIASFCRCRLAMLPLNKLFTRRSSFGARILDAAVKIVKSTRFDDVDHDLGYEYRGYNYSVQNEGDMFLVRTYDDEPGCAIVVSPTTAHANGNLRQLVNFLQAEFGVSRIRLNKGDLGSYAEIDLKTLAFLTI